MSVAFIPLFSIYDKSMTYDHFLPNMAILNVAGNENLHFSQNWKQNYFKPFLVISELAEFAKNGSHT